jgi:signal transduction histidine kinase
VDAYLPLSPNRWWLVRIITTVAGAGLVAAAVVLAMANERLYQTEKTQEITTEGHVLARFALDPLKFNDPAMAQHDLKAMEANPGTEAIAIYNARNVLFAYYSRSAEQPLPTAPPPDGISHVANRLIVSLPVVHRGARLGSVYLDSVIQPLTMRLRRYIGVGLLFMMGGLLVVVLGSAHSALGIANDQLEWRASELAAANRQLSEQMDGREKAEQALRQSQKMEAIGRLTSGLAHDFNNLLTVIAGNLEMIDRPAAKALPHDRLLRLVHSAQEAVKSGEQLTHQLLSFSRQQPVEARVADVDAAIQEFAPLVRQAIGEKMRLVLDLRAAVGRCKLDLNQFEAAILNLAINARDACKGNGSLTIATDIALRLEPDAPNDEAAVQEIRIIVSDTGSGIPPEVLSHIFEPFYTTKPTGKGTGLGLAQVWGFANRFGGRITVDSECGRGTTFQLYFPLTQDTIDDARQAKGRSSHDRRESAQYVA